MISKIIIVLTVTVIAVFVENSSAKECNRETLVQCIYDTEATLRYIAPETEDFDQLNRPFNERKNVRPAAFLVAQKTYDVQMAVKCLKKFKCPFSVKSGGHCHEGYSFGGDGFYILDLSNLSRIDVQKRPMKAEIGPGATLGSISSHLYKTHGVGLPVGTLQTASIGGFALNGGWGFSSRKHGLLSQNVIEMTFVNAEGEVMTVNELENKELFFALRGAGGGNFGVVTQYTVKLFDAPKEVSVLKIVYNFGDFKDVFSKWQLYANKFDESVTSMLLVSKDTITLISVVNHDDELVRTRLVSRVLSHFSLLGMKACVQNVNYDAMNELLYRTFGEYKIRKSKSNFVDRLLTANEIETLYVSLSEMFAKHPNLLNFNYEFGGQIESSFQNSAFIHTHHSYLFQLLLVDDPTVNVIDPIDTTVIPPVPVVDTVQTPFSPPVSGFETSQPSIGSPLPVINTVQPPIDTPIDTVNIPIDAREREAGVVRETITIVKNTGVNREVVIDEVVREEVFDNVSSAAEQLANVYQVKLDAMKKFFEETAFMDSGYSYQGFMDEDVELKRYYGEYITTLERIKCTYDYENVFNYKQSIPLKCGRLFTSSKLEL